MHFCCIHVYIYTYICPPEVLQSLEALTKCEHTKPFKINETYKAAWEARVAEGQEDQDGEDGENKTIKSKAKPKKAKKNKPKKSKKSKTLLPSAERSSPKKRVAPHSSYEPHVYREARGNFILALREKGQTYTMANMAWNFSSEKAHLLGGVPFGRAGGE